MYLTDDCNLRCKYCYEGDRKNKSYMTESTLEKCLAFIVENNMPNDNIDLLLLGGEPLMNKQILFKVVDIINQKYMKIKELFQLQITTNGILLDPKTVSFLVENQVMTSISIDGDRETHNLNRHSVNGKDVYDIIMKNMFYMLENNVDFAVRMTVTTNNVHLLYKNVLYFYDMGVKKINIGLDQMSKWSEEQINEYDQQLTQLDEFYLNTLIKNDDCILNLYDYKISTFVYKRMPSYCSAGSTNHLIINSKGEFFPCGFVSNQKPWNMGSVTTQFDRKKFISTARCNVKKCSSCKQCDIAFTCSGAKCGFLNYKMTGFLNQHHENICRLQRILYNHNYKVIKELYQNYNKRVMNFIELAFSHKTPLSTYMLDIMRSVEQEREVI